MIRKIVKGKEIFKIAEEATIQDSFLAKDLTDTLNFNRKICVGMAANMIGFNKRVIICAVGLGSFVMFNPKITKCSGKYEAIEGCLSLDGTRKTIRYKEIEVEYLDSSFIKKKETFKGTVAQILQHEIDHINGKII